MKGREVVPALGLIVLGILSFGFGEAPGPGPERGPLGRLLGPFARLGADLQWIRFQRATLAGDQERALSLASLALELAPEDEDGWERLALHLALNLASTTREPDPATRRALFEAALCVLAEGRDRVRRPGRLWFAEGLLLFNKAEFDPELVPGGSLELQRLSAAAFRSALELGESDASDFVDYLERELPR